MVLQPLNREILNPHGSAVNHPPDLAFRQRGRFKAPLPDFLLDAGVNLPVFDALALQLGMAQPDKILRDQIEKLHYILEQAIEFIP